MSYSFFGENENIFGYKNLCVKLYYSCAKLNIFLGIKFSSMVNTDQTGGVAPDDVMKAITSDFETKICTTKFENEFSNALAKENSFVPNGNTILNEFSNGNVEQHLQIYEASPDTVPGIDCHEQMHALYTQCQELLKRTRRVQVQQKHRNLTKQMKVFVSQQQKFSTVTCQRFNDRCNVSQNGLSQESKDKILSTIDTLRYNLRHLESKYDSDATDSSSGSESCDEFEERDYRNSTYPVPEAHASTSTLPSTSSSSSSDLNRHLPIRNRSSWKWCTERSAIASRWSWLQAQVTDLETKLRQQNDIFRHLRATKGSIVFGEDERTRRQFPSSSSINANHASLNNFNCPHHQSTSPSLSSTSLSQPPQPPPPSPPQLLHGNNNVGVPSSSETMTTVSAIAPNSQPESTEQQQQQPQPEVALQQEEEVKEDDGESSCMRMIPYVSMKRRKLVRSESTLSVAVKKAVKYSSIQCSCNIYPPYVPPCVICTGRYSYMHSIDSEFMPYYERVSLLDSSCHPVLCLPNDVPLGIHFTQLLKRENIHSKPVLLRNNKKKKFNNSLSPLLISSSADGSQKTKKLTASNSISKPKRKFDKNKRLRLSSTDSLKKVNRERFSSGCSSRAESPIPSPSPSETSSNGASNLTPTTPSAPLHRRRRSEQHAFDINNIVIPYSIAAANRIEKLQYKEIITPKWRINEEFSIPPPEDVKMSIINGNHTTNNIGSSNSHDEDISQSAFEMRHSKYEESERQRRIHSIYRPV